MLATTADELVVRVCLAIGLGHDGASLGLPQKGGDGDDKEGAEQWNKRRARREGQDEEARRVVAT